MDISNCMGVRWGARNDGEGYGQGKGWERHRRDFRWAGMWMCEQCEVGPPSRLGGGRVVPRRCVGGGAGGSGTHSL